MSEDRPHIVFPKAVLEGEVRMFRNYKDAHAWWQRLSTYKFPYIIATLGREIDPAVPVIDPNE